MNLLFVSSEYFPYAKAGGLGDAVASLAEALVLRGHTVHCVLPRYGSIALDGLEDLHLPLGVPLGRREEWVGVHATVHAGVRLCFLDHRALFDRSGIYGPDGGTAYDDNARRVALLSRGALQLARALDLKPDVIHAHDWPTALVPVYREAYYRETALASARTVLSIHNLGYQGVFAARDAAELGVRDEVDRRMRLTEGETINLLRAGLIASDRIVAVSPRYALEIHQPEHGFGLHRVIQQRTEEVSGILNGIDTNEWDPSTDERIDCHYTAENLAGKWRCKARLQHDLGLPIEGRTAVIGMVTRLATQKGVQSLFSPQNGAIRRICRQLPVQVVLLGSGERWVEAEVRRLNDELPNFRGVIGYDDRLAHLVEAGSDFFLMPSTYEPCGLNQMYSMRYGTVPIVTRTGGLADTVDHETGYFIEEHSPEAILLTVERAVADYAANPQRVDRMRANGMSRDFGWLRSAEAYEAVYSSPAR